MLRRSVFAITLASALAVASLPALAFEPTGNPVADTFLSIMAAGQSSVTHGAVKTEGSDVVIDNLAVDKYLPKSGNAGPATLTVDTVTIDGGNVTDTGGLTAAALSFAGMKIASDTGHSVTVHDAIARQVDLPSPKALDGNALSEYNFWHSVELNDIMLTATDMPAGIPIAQASATITDFDHGVPMGGQFAIRNMVIDDSLIDDQGSRKQLEDLGYKQIDLTITGKTRYEPTSGDVSVRDLTLSAKDMGELSFSMKLGGITPELVTKLQQVQSDNVQSALALMSNVTVSGLSLSFHDEGLVDRALTQQAKQAGVDKAQLAAALGEQVAPMLATLQNPQFEKQIETAVTSFLQNPGTISVAAAPPAPVGFPQLVGVAMMAPQTLPAALNLSVSASH